MDRAVGERGAERHEVDLVTRPHPRATLDRHVDAIVQLHLRREPARHDRLGLDSCHPPEHCHLAGLGHEAGGEEVSLRDDGHICGPGRPDRHLGSGVAPGLPLEEDRALSALLPRCSRRDAGRRRAVETGDAQMLAREDEVRVRDDRLVGPMDLRPAEGIAEVGAGEVPERVARPDLVGCRLRGLRGRFLGGQRSCDGQEGKRDGAACQTVHLIAPDGVVSPDTGVR
jgi:hypothetical protein